MNEWPLLTLLTLTPVVGGLLLLGLGVEQPRLVKAVALGFSLVALALAGCVWAGFDPGAPGLQFEERYLWVPGLGVEYFVGVDGLGLVMVLLTALLVPLSLAIGWDRDGRDGLYHALVLFLQAGLFGVFTALNFFIVEASSPVLHGPALPRTATPPPTLPSSSAYFRYPPA